tara:strand:+ start:127 stop:381 length:255 start_codon:yes stop_codon:yes gene_type:complete
MLKQLFEKNLPNYYKQVSEKEVYVYMSNVEQVIQEARDRIKQLQTEAHNEQRYDESHAYHRAWIELSFTSAEILSKQLTSEIKK